MESVPLDGSSVTSMFFKLSLDYGVVSMKWDEGAGQWIVDVEGQGFWTGTTQAKALEAATRDLEGSE
jgi:hypothetical protein